MGSLLPQLEGYLGSPGGAGGEAAGTPLLPNDSAFRTLASPMKVHHTAPCAGEGSLAVLPLSPCSVECGV